MESAGGGDVEERGDVEQHNKEEGDEVDEACTHSRGEAKHHGPRHLELGVAHLFAQARDHALPREDVRWHEPADGERPCLWPAAES